MINGTKYFAVRSSRPQLLAVARINIISAPAV